MSVCTSGLITRSCTSASPAPAKRRGIGRPFFVVAQHFGVLWGGCARPLVDDLDTYEVELLEVVNAALGAAQRWSSRLIAQWLSTVDRSYLLDRLARTAQL